MGLREQAEQAFREIMSDNDGAVWPVTLVNPAGVISAPFNGRTNDIHLMIDPNTGMAVSGRQASVVISWREIQDSGLGTPEGIADGTAKPWLARFDDLYGASYEFKIRETHPDRDIGSLVCILEVWS